ncbi:MAG: hypothetical protein NTX76_02145 [Alphaproteobacteria bacterium]|nr:hypothetical protein [Alphaproteobacteria bacterium]
MNITSKFSKCRISFVNTVLMVSIGVAAFMVPNAAFGARTRSGAQTAIDDCEYPEVRQTLGGDNRLYNDWLNGPSILHSGDALRFFSGDKTLDRLELRKEKIGDLGAILVAKVLEKNHTLIDLDLAYNGIGNLGAIAIARALKENTRLNKLDISHNSIGNNNNHEGGNIENSAGKAIGSAIKKNLGLSRLVLSNNCLGTSEAVKIANALETNHTLSHLSLPYNKIGRDGIAALIYVVDAKQTASIKKLYFSHNSEGNGSGYTKDDRKRVIESISQQQGNGKHLTLKNVALLLDPDKLYTGPSSVHDSGDSH